MLWFPGYAKIHSVFVCKQNPVSPCLSFATLDSKRMCLMTFSRCRANSRELTLLIWINAFLKMDNKQKYLPRKANDGGWGVSGETLRVLAGGHFQCFVLSGWSELQDSPWSFFFFLSSLRLRAKALREGQIRVGGGAETHMVQMPAVWKKLQCN